MKSGCIKFRDVLITDTGMDPFQSCTNAGACTNVLRTSHLKPESIGRVPVKGYCSLLHIPTSCKGYDLHVCHFNGCHLSTKNTHLNKYMGDLYRGTMKWVSRVTNCGYMLSVMLECEWENLVT